MLPMKFSSFVGLSGSELMSMVQRTLLENALALEELEAVDLAQSSEFALELSDLRKERAVLRAS